MNKKILTPTVTRRELVQSTAAVLSLFAIGAAAKAEKAPALIRPPKVTDEEDFLARCIKCGRCISVCPTNVISAAEWTDGLRNLRTPVMDYRRGGCEFCDKCIDVCPTGALQHYDGETTNIGKAVLTNVCIALRTGGCTKCHDVCEYDAVILDDQKRPSIDPEKCNGCGKCVSACLALVFQAFESAKVRGIQIHPLEEGEKR